MADLIKEIISENQAIVVNVSRTNYMKDTSSLISTVTDFSKGICYVTLNRPTSNVLTPFFKDEKKKELFLFVDATKTENGGAEQDNIIFLTSPRAVTELSIILSKILDTGKITYLVFDSLSTLLVYETEEVVTKFMRNLINKLRSSNTKGIFIMLDDTFDSNLFKDLSMLVDKIVASTGEEYVQKESAKQ